MLRAGQSTGQRAQSTNRVSETWDTGTKTPAPSEGETRTLGRPLHLDKYRAPSASHQKGLACVELWAERGCPCACGVQGFFFFFLPGTEGKHAPRRETIETEHLTNRVHVH